MGQALYRKYRSRSLDEVVGQEHITETLKRAIKSGRVSHAYLFTGPHGVGKTSIARILAHELNGVAYDSDDAHLDIIEIDAASNGGVDEVRDLRDKVYIAPSSGKYKVYIIDEVHMMTTSAFNALLKTLEEPPAHAIFILATTEAHKLPATIISRTQRFIFKPIEQGKMIAHLRHIADTEKITIDDDALALIAEHSEGTFRDAISMLDQASSSAKKIDRTTIEALLGIPSNARIEQLLALLQTHQASDIAQALVDFRAEGYQAAAIAKQLARSLRAGFLNGAPALPASDTLTLLNRLIEVPASHNSEQLLEVVLLEAALGGADQVVSEPTPVRPAIKTPSTPATPPEPTPKKPDPVENDADDVPASSAVIDTNVWQALLEALKKQYNTLYGIIRMAHADFSPGHIALTFGFAFHQKRANDPKNKKIITSLLEELTGEKLSLECKYDKSATPSTPAANAMPDQPVPGPALGAISAVFGGGEVIP